MSNIETLKQELSLLREIKQLRHELNGSNGSDPKRNRHRKPISEATRLKQSRKKKQWWKDKKAQEKAEAKKK